MFLQNLKLQTTFFQAFFAIFLSICTHFNSFNQREKTLINFCLGEGSKKAHVQAIPQGKKSSKLSSIWQREYSSPRMSNSF